MRPAELAPEDAAISEVRLETMVGKACQLLADGKAAQARALLARALVDEMGIKSPYLHLRIIHHLARAEAQLSRSGSPPADPRQVDYERSRELLQSVTVLYRKHADFNLLIERDLLWAQIDRQARPDWAEACLLRAIHRAEGAGWGVAAAMARLDLIERLELAERAEESAEQLEALKRAALASESVRHKLAERQQTAALELSALGITGHQAGELRNRLKVLQRLTAALEREAQQKARQAYGLWQRLRRALGL